MDTLLPQEEATDIKSYIFDLYDEGVEKGMQKGMQKGMEKGMQKGMEKAMQKIVAAYLRNNPTATDQEVAKILEAPPASIKKVRENSRRNG